MIQEAFAQAECCDGNEQDLTEELRQGDAFIPELSLAAEIEGELAGHILFTEGKVGEDAVLILAPLAVHPKFQRKGVGTALILEGHKRARELGYDYSLVLGSETYYPRCGYIPAEKLGVEVPEGFPSKNFMAIRLRDEAKRISGQVTYPKEFGL